MFKFWPWHTASGHVQSEGAEPGVPVVATSFCSSSPVLAALEIEAAATTDKVTCSSSRASFFTHTLVSSASRSALAAMEDVDAWNAHLLDLLLGECLSHRHKANFEKLTPELASHEEPLT